jgi:hypothetical protein
MSTLQLAHHGLAVLAAGDGILDWGNTKVAELSTFFRGFSVVAGKRCPGYDQGEGRRRWRTQRPHRRLVAFRGRTDTTAACSASSNSTPSTTTFTNPSSPAHNLAERTPFPSPSIHLSDRQEP